MGQPLSNAFCSDRTLLTCQLQPIEGARKKKLKQIGMEFRDRYSLAEQLKEDLAVDDVPAGESTFSY